MDNLKELIDSDTCIKMYDADKQELIDTYSSGKRCASAAGLNIGSVIYSYTNRTRTYSKLLDKNVAFRLTKKVEGMQFDKQGRLKK